VEPGAADDRTQEWRHHTEDDDGDERDHEDEKH